ncbi:MAG: hypothetical protein JO101_05880 [Candidatus Eremiobacteraeota bacterium]|nr:hypothetical protein [Candidatus Eremiobacteraeota bacterium]MBV8354827.1 hypothetical protein [Candidatus Eremiobacteraeota bacterium]
MRIAYTVSRILLGLIFAVLGMNGFIPYIPMNPSMVPQTAMSFFMAMTTSHFAYFVYGVQVLSGILLLANRYVVLALVMLAGIITNILAFHITMWPQSLVPMPILVTILWFIAAWGVRAYFAPIFTPKAEVA